jgi:hypothetical protein
MTEDGVSDDSGRSSSPTQSSSAPGDRMDLLFITHSGTSPGKSDRQHINRRVQKNAFIKRKQARQQANDSRRHVAPHRLFGDFTRRESTANSSPSSSSLRWTSALPTMASAPVTVEAAHFLRAKAGVGTMLESSRLGQIRPGKISLTSEMQNILNWYFQVVLPAVEPTQSEQDDYIKWTLPQLNDEPVLLYSLLTCMAHDIEQASVGGFGPPTRRSMATERLHYRVEAIKALNEALSNPTESAMPATLFAVHFLLWQEVCSLLLENEAKADASRSFMVTSPCILMESRGL